MFFHPPPRGRMPFMGRRGNGGNGHLGVMLLIANVLKIGLEHIPPVTLGVVAFCTALYLGLVPIARGFHEGNTCFNFMDLLVVTGAGAATSAHTSSFLWRMMQFVASPITSFVSFTFTERPNPRTHSMSLQFTPSLLRRLTFSNFFHASDFHLYYNMMSWLYKGRTYELVFGSEFMLLWLVCAVVGTSIMYIVLCSVIVFVLKDPSSILGDSFGSWLEPNACVVGFSGVIFCLKTVLNYYNVQAHGELDEAIFIPYLGPIFNTPLRHAVWAELIVIQLITPHVSFIGHLAGILTGFIFIAINLEGKLRPLAEGLKTIRESLFMVIPRAADAHAHQGANGNRREQQAHNNQPPPPPPRGNEHLPRGEAGGFGW